MGLLCCPFTNLDGLPIPGSDDIPWLVGLAARHIFTKRGQTYWKDIVTNMKHAGSPLGQEAAGEPWKAHRHRYSRLFHKRQNVISPVAQLWLCQAEHM